MQQTDRTLAGGYRLAEHFDASMRLLAHTLGRRGVHATPAALAQLAQSGDSRLNAAPSRSAAAAVPKQDRELVARKG